MVLINCISKAIISTPQEGGDTQSKETNVTFPTARECSKSSKSMAAASLTTITEQWIRDRLQLKHPCLGNVVYVNTFNRITGQLMRSSNAKAFNVRMCNAVLHQV